MLHTTRALRRAHAAATARNAITARRPKLILGTITGGVLGLALTVGIVSARELGISEDKMMRCLAALGHVVTITVSPADDEAGRVEVACA